jgi:glycosyltransferase involved in cell wall biosynthesis
MTPEVCVVIPTRNRESVVAALDSVLAQTFRDFEIVVVDEGSEPPVTESLIPPDARITVVRHDVARGPAAARNAGAERSDAPFVAFLDDDDWWLPGKLAATLQCLHEHPSAGTVEHRAAWAGEPISATGGACELLDDPVRRMLVRQPPHVDCVVVRRSVHDAVRFDEGFAASADLDYMLRLAIAAPVVRIDRVLAVHGVGGPPSDVSRRARIDGRLRFRAKHESLFADRQVNAFFELRLGHQYRRAGRRWRACRCFAAACTSRHVAWHGVKGLVMALRPGRAAET